MILPNTPNFYIDDFAKHPTPMSQRAASSANLFKDAVMLLGGVKLLRAVGISPSSAYGGTAVGFFAGNMAGVYGFDARDTLKALDGGESKTRS